MSRKREPPVLDNPRAKRQLHARLAAELEALRISSGRSRRIHVPRNVFGASASSSPFLASSSSSRGNVSGWRDSKNGSSFDSRMEFGNGFAEVLDSEVLVDEEDRSPEIETPGSSSSSSMSTGLNDPYPVLQTTTGAYPNCSQVDENEVIVEEMDVPETEKRLVVYRPPVRTSSQSLARINASLPDSHYIARNARNDEWILKEVNNDRMKRKLALVPWRGDAKKIRDDFRRAPKVIPMPWHDQDSATDQAEARASPLYPESTMEIEEIP